MIILLFNIFCTNLIFGQGDFKPSSFIVKKQNDEVIKKDYRNYKLFDFNLSEIKNHIRKNKENKKKPIEFFLTLDNEKLIFNLFENDIFDDGYYEISNGKKVSKDKLEIHTYAGFVGDNPKNALRLFISDEIISGFFMVDGVSYVIRNLSDLNIQEKSKNLTCEVIIAKAEDEISKLGDNYCAVSNSVKGGRLNVLSATYPGYVVPCANQSSFPTCKYIKIKVASDPQFLNMSSSATKSATIISYVNQIDLIMFQQLNIRLRLAVAPIVYTNPISTTSTTTTNLSQAFADYTAQRQNVFANPDVNVIEYYLSGRTFYNFSIPYQVGKAEPYSLGRPGNPAGFSTINTYSSQGPVSLSSTDCYLVMAHEIGHTIGANHPGEVGYNCSPISIMCDQPNKTPVYNAINVKEIQCYLTTYQNGLFSSNTSSGFSNIFNLNFNNTPFVNSPININQADKIVSINSTPYTLNSGTTYTSSNSSVYFYYKNTTSTKFKIGTAPWFNLNITASDQCNTYYRTITFVYSASGARLSSIGYPNPSSDVIYFDNQLNTNEEKTRIESISIYTDQGVFLDRVLIPENSLPSVNTSGLKNGKYLLKLLKSDGLTESKTIIVQH